MAGAERLLYSYQVRVGQPAMSQTYYLDVKHIKLYSWDGVKGVIGGPCLAIVLHTTTRRDQLL